MPTIERGWLSVTEAAQYVGLSHNVVSEAVASHQLPAYEKPVTMGRKASNPANQRHHYRIARSDLDAWVRSWPKA